MPQEWAPTYALMNQSADFVMGFEVGRFWQECEAGNEVDGVFHVSNEGELLRVADHFGLSRLRWHPVGSFAHGVFARSVS